MADFTSILNIIFIISGGVLTFIILFIFAKRQITRFALRSRRGPHVSIGSGSKKSLKKEIDRRIEAVPRIMCEPRLLSTEPTQYILEPQQPYHYRFRAIDDIKTLEDEIAARDPSLRRRPRESLRAFLLTALAAPLDGHGQRLVHQFCDAYESARHRPAEYAEDEHRAYTRMMMKLLDAARLVGGPGGAAPRAPRPRPLPRANRLCVGNNKYTALENPTDKLEEEPPPPPAARDETAV